MGCTVCLSSWALRSRSCNSHHTRLDAATYTASHSVFSARRSWDKCCSHPMQQWIVVDGSLAGGEEDFVMDLGPREGLQGTRKFACAHLRSMFPYPQSSRQEFTDFVWSNELAASIDTGVRWQLLSVRQMLLGSEGATGEVVRQACERS